MAGIPEDGINDKVRELCIVAALSDEGEEFEAAIRDLTIALRTQAQTAENLVLSMLLDTQKRKP